MAEQTGSPGFIAEDDVVTLLMRQHDEIRRLLDAVQTTVGADRRETFERLVRLLTVHETAEEEIVHPYARTAFAGAESVVAARLEEERRAKESLSRLAETDPDDPAFLRRFARLREDVRAHARAEELEEFFSLQQETDPARRRAMAKAVRAAEAVAPTRPHPGMESAAGNVAAGLPMALMDRTRDAVREAMR